MMCYMLDDDIGIRLFSSWGCGGKYIIEINMDSEAKGIYTTNVTCMETNLKTTWHMDGRNISMYIASGKMTKMSDSDIAKHMLVSV